jgi:hypothetical protein
MGNDLLEIQMPGLVTFQVILTNANGFGYIHTGMVKMCRDNFGMETHTIADEVFVRSLTINVAPEYAVWVFTYLFHCMEVGGYVEALTVEPIVGIVKPLFETFTKTIPDTDHVIEWPFPYPEEVDATKNTDGTYSPPPSMRADQTLVIREKEE